MSCARETTLTLFVMYLYPQTSGVYLLVNLFTKLYITFILHWIAFIFGRDEDEGQEACGVQERQISLSPLCTYFP